jgi:dienelactone hydrolase
MLVGKGTGREAVRLIEDTRGIVLAGVDYPYDGDPKPKGLDLLRHLPAMQKALIDTPPAVLLAIDYLAKQPYVDPERIELVGVSLGAFVASVPGALEPRIRRVWLIHGAGEPSRVLAHGLRNYVPFTPARRALGHLLGVVTCSHHLGPELWVGRISPRPVIVINAPDDDALPASSIEALHRALGDPHEIVWMPGGHVLPHRADLVEAIANRVFERITPVRGPGVPAESADDATGD